jgi:hypothetical protein
MIALMMEAVCTSDTPVILYQTTGRNIPEDSPPHTRRRENLKSRPILVSLFSASASNESKNRFGFGTEVLIIYSHLSKGATLT